MTAAVILLLTSCASTDLLTDSVKVQYNLGNAYMQLGKTQEAEQAFLMTLEEYPGYSDAAYNLALLYTESGEFSEALSIVSSFIEAEKTDKDWRFLEAYLYYQSEDSNKALSAYAQLLKEWPGADLQLETAKIAMNFGQYDVAQEYLLDLFNNGNMSGELLFLLGEFDVVTGGGDGMDWYQTAVLEDPGYLPSLEKFLESYADAETGSEVYLELYSILKQAAESHPDETVILMELGRRSFALQMDEGIDHVRKAIELGYDDLDSLLTIYDSLDGSLAEAYLTMLESKNLIRVLRITDDLPTETVDNTPES